MIQYLKERRGKKARATARLRGSPAAAGRQADRH